MSNIRELSQLASVIVVDNSTKYVGIGSTLPGSKLSIGGDAYISGNTRVVGILSVGSGTITIDGDNGLIGVGTVTLTETQVSQLGDLTGEDGNFSGNVSIAGTVIATAYYGDGSTLDGIVSDLVEDPSPQLGGNLDLNGNDITGTGNINITGNISIGGTLTYEDVTNIDSIGLVTARSGVIINTGTATTALIVNGDARITGILTIGTSSIKLDGSNNQVNVGTGITLHHTNGIQVGANRVHSTGLTVNQINVSGVVTATTFDGDLNGNSLGLSGNPDISVNNIVGTAVTFGGISYPTLDGSQNQVLATNGSGVLQFLSLSDLSGFDWSIDQDFGLITDSTNESIDLGETTDAVLTNYEIGFIATGGVLYPDTFVLPSYTVSTLPSANPAGGMLFVTDETGGSVPAFSDGTNWRRITDRQVVS